MKQREQQQGVDCEDADDRAAARAIRNVGPVSHGCSTPAPQSCCGVATQSFHRRKFAAHSEPQDPPRIAKSLARNPRKMTISAA
jgi:hypothetical protein